MTQYKVTIEIDDEAEEGTFCFVERGVGVHMTYNAWASKDLITEDWVVSDGYETRICPTWEEAKTALIGLLNDQLLEREGAEVAR